MNRLQFEQWKEFSTKAIGILKITEARRSKLKTNILQFFEEVVTQDRISDIERWEDVMDLFHDFFDEFRVRHEGEKYSSFQSQLNATTRAGIDIISGDVGVPNWFTSGDIKAMFEGQVPDHVAARFTLIAFENDENVLPL